MQYTYNEQYCYKDKLLVVCLKEAPLLNKKTVIIGLTKHLAREFCVVNGEFSDL